MRRNILVSLIGWIAVVLLTAAQPPDTLWTRTFGSTVDSWCYSVQQTSDGGFILGGKLEGAGMYLLKTDSLGIMEWDKIFEGGYICRSVQQTEDGGFILGGSAFLYNEDMCLIKTDSLGNLQWQQTIGYPEPSEHCGSVQQTIGGGYILGGSTFDYFYSIRDAYLVKTDSMGSLEWEQSIGGPGEQSCLSVRQTTDGGYILGGVGGIGVGGIPSNLYRYLAKTDSLGNLQWEQDFGVPGYDVCKSVLQTTDGGYMLGGSVEVVGSDYIDMYMLKTDSWGNLLWEQTFGGDQCSWGSSLQKVVDGGYILGGYTSSFGAIGWDLYLVKTDSLGNLEWQWTLRDSLWQTCESVQQTADGGYILGGTCFNEVSYHEMYLVRLGAAGSPHVHDFVTVEQAKFILHPVHPNPFNPTTMISFSLPMRSLVTLEVFNIHGRSVGAVRQPPLHDQWLNPGIHNITFDGTSLASGIYIYRLSAGEFTASGKMLLLK